MLLLYLVNTLSVISFGPFIGGHPPNSRESVFDADALNINPLSWRWKAGGVVANEFLTKVESALLKESKERSER